MPHAFRTWSVAPIRTAREAWQKQTWIVPAWSVRVPAQVVPLHCMRPGHPRRKAAGCCPHCGHKTVRMEGTRIAFRLASYDRDRASELVKCLCGQRTRRGW